eukprot:5352207-Prymnesium_polylepis.1
MPEPSVTQPQTSAVSKPSVTLPQSLIFSRAHDRARPGPTGLPTIAYNVRIAESGMHFQGSISASPADLWIATDHAPVAIESEKCDRNVSRHTSACFERRQLVPL